jgi:hypothetical protein
MMNEFLAMKYFFFWGRFSIRSQPRDVSGLFLKSKSGPPHEQANGLDVGVSGFSASPSASPFSLQPPSLEGLAEWQERRRRSGRKRKKKEGKTVRRSYRLANMFFHGLSFSPDVHPFLLLTAPIRVQVTKSPASSPAVMLFLF